MSNDIIPSASRVPDAAAAVAGAQTARPAEVAREAQPPAPVKPAPAAKVDLKEIRQTLREAAEHLNQQMVKNSRDLSFSVDDLANTVVVTVKNRSGEVVRQIPSEVALRVAHSLDDMKGLLKDEKM